MAWERVYVHACERASTTFFGRLVRCSAHGRSFVILYSNGVSNMNSWTHFSSWRLWFTCKALASERVPSAEIWFPLRLQNVRNKWEVVQQTPSLCVQKMHTIYPHSQAAFWYFQYSMASNWKLGGGPWMWLHATIHGSIIVSNVLGSVRKYQHRPMNDTTVSVHTSYE